MYGMDFRPGINTLPRHDTIQLPPIDAYRAYVASLPRHGACRASPTPERLRRVVLMCSTGESIPEACRRLGLNYMGTRTRLKQMPNDLLGPVLTARMGMAA